MNAMLGKLITTRKGNLSLNCAFAAVGILLVIIVDDERTGIITFLAVTTLESGAFSLIYGLRSTWRRSDAARSIFWVVTAYFANASQALTMYLSSKRWWWTDDLRELLYLGLAIAGLNLVLTLARVLSTQLYTRHGHEQ